MRKRTERNKMSTKTKLKEWRKFGSSVFVLYEFEAREHRACLKIMRVLGVVWKASYGKWIASTLHRMGFTVTHYGKLSCCKQFVKDHNRPLLKRKTKMQAPKTKRKANQIMSEILEGLEKKELPKTKLEFHKYVERVVAGLTPAEKEVLRKRFGTQFKNLATEE